MKGKFVIYSGGSRYINKSLDTVLIGLCGQNKSISYIPVTHDQDPVYYQEFKKYYQHYGVNKFCYFALDRQYSQKHWDKAFSSSVIYLDGGNTYHFLQNILESGLSKHLKHFIKKGGIIAGQSAGVINLTPNILTAAIPTLDADDAILGFKKTKSLGILPFEFSPHFSGDKQSIEELKQYSKKTTNEILACDDGSGVIIVDDKITYVGKVFCFQNGIFSKK